MLSSRDNTIFAKLFDPETQSTGPVILERYERSLPGLPEVDFDAAQQRELAAIRSLNEENPEPSRIQECIKSLSDIINCQPRYASAYVNRAQARRMGLPYAALFTSDSQDEMKDILSDLDTGIKLASPTQLAVTPHQRKVLSAAHTHKGLLLLLASDKSREGPIYGLDGDVPPDTLEEYASNELAKGGTYGNSMAQSLAVKTNPYAKLCGSIVKEAQRREMVEYALAHG